MQNQGMLVGYKSEPIQALVFSLCPHTTNNLTQSLIHSYQRNHQDAISLQALLYDRIRLLRCSFYDTHE